MSTSGTQEKQQSSNGILFEDPGAHFPKLTPNLPQPCIGREISTTAETGKFNYWWVRAYSQRVDKSLPGHKVDLGWHKVSLGFIYECTYARLTRYMYTHAYAYMKTRGIKIYTYVHMCIHVCMCIYMYVCIHVYLYIYIHV